LLCGKTHKDQYYCRPCSAASPPTWASSTRKVLVR
jgi:hypothetical protein